MFRYINMPKLVAYYLREFSLRSDGEPSDLYKFIFCLCLPFVSGTFRRAWLTSLAIAECTNSKDQILRLLATLTGAEFSVVSYSDEYYAPFTPDTGVVESTDFVFSKPDSGADSDPLVPFLSTANVLMLAVKLNGASQTEVESYLSLLIPFYIKIEIRYL